MISKNFSGQQRENCLFLIYFINNYIMLKILNKALILSNFLLFCSDTRLIDLFTFEF